MRVGNALRPHCLVELRESYLYPTVHCSLSRPHHSSIPSAFLRSSMSSSPSAPKAAQAPATRRSSSRGAFELHVQSVRASRGLPHLVDATPAQQTHVVAAPPPPYQVTPMTAQISTREEKTSEKDKDFDLESTITISDIKFETKSNRQTTDDGPEPKTLARAMFRFGFCTSPLLSHPIFSIAPHVLILFLSLSLVFPIFWFIGASILFMDLRYYQTAEELAEDPRSIDEKKADLAVLRRAEVRWAWRSLYAIVSFILILASVLLIWAGATGKFTGFQ